MTIERLSSENGIPFDSSGGLIAEIVKRSSEFEIMDPGDYRIKPFSKTPFQLDVKVSRRGNGEIIATKDSPTTPHIVSSVAPTRTGKYNLKELQDVLVVIKKDRRGVQRLHEAFRYTRR